MYYIVNLDNQVVAADSDFLSLLKIDNLQELFTKLISEELKFNELNENLLEIVTGANTMTLTQSRHPLSTLMGDLHLIELSETEETASTHIDLLPDEESHFLKPARETEIEKEELKGEAGEEILGLEPKKDAGNEIDLLPDEGSEVNFLADDKEIDFVKFDTEPEEETEKEINLLPDEESRFLKPTEEIGIEKEEEEASALSDESIFIDLDKASEILGISKEDYSGFLDEFIDKAIDQEEAVKDSGSAEHHKAVLSLQKLAQMLHLTALSAILEKIEKESGKKEKGAIEAFYHTLSNLTTHIAKPDDTVAEPEEEKYDNAICHLTHDDIKPIHFDFQIEKASEDLGLPVELIEEFVNDFIDQAHEEKKGFVNACKKGDIDAIHRMAHKLKGVASNLRINPLAETLEELQFCEDKSRFEPLLKKYWGQFLALELYMNNISHHLDQGRK